VSYRAKPKKPEYEAPKFDPEERPLLKKATEKVEPAKPVIFNSGDL
jgi:survival-of-motor-neuron-related-splicing factor 30